MNALEIKSLMNNSLKKIVFGLWNKCDNLFYIFNIILLNFLFKYDFNNEQSIFVKFEAYYIYREKDE